ncbi:TNT domain-containing protein [Beutenbergia cavernae]|nr:TNT domain-containing protein [Beutenbergia cavernae]
MDIERQQQQQMDAARALHAAVQSHDFAEATIEWSQAGAQHSGRAHVHTRDGGVVRIDVPDGAVTALGQLRREMAEPEKGTWLSTTLTLARDGRTSITFNYDERPYWNSPGPTMAQAPAGEPIPTDEQWDADLRYYPREPSLVPPWLRDSVATPGAASRALRTRLDASGYPPSGVILLGEKPETPPVEGAMEVRQTGPHRFAAGTRDYGVFEQYFEGTTEKQACDWLWDYLVRPVAPATVVPAHDLQQRAAGYQHAYAGVYAQLQQMGQGATVTTLQPGVALDRLGAIDGVYLFPWGTPYENRSLPPSAVTGDARLYQFVTAVPLHVEAEIVPPWFGRPGGALRFRIAQNGTGVRQLVQNGTLLEVRVQG